MVSASDDLLTELVRLRRGWGLQSHTLRGRIGPELVGLCGIAGSDSSRRIREKVTLWLREASAELPPELARALLVAFALDRGHQYPTLTERVESFASERSWGPRTARRRIDHATRSVAQAVTDRAGSGAGPGNGPQLAAVLRLDATNRDPAGADTVVVRVPVPLHRFDLLIRFEAS